MRPGARLAQLVFWMPALQLLFGTYQIPGPAFIAPAFAAYLLARCSPDSRAPVADAVPGGIAHSSFSTCRSVGNSFIQSSAIAMVPTPPSTAAGTVPNSAAVTPLSNWPSWFEALMNRKFTAPTRPRIVVGRRKLHQREADHDADGVGRAEHGQRQHRQPHPLRQREHHRRRAEDDHRLEHPHARRGG